MNQPGSAAGQDGADQPLPTGPVFPEAAAAPASKPAVPDYELLKRIGKGSFGEVWLARSKATGILRAAKIVWRHTFEEERPYRREFEGVQKFERVSREHPSQLALFHIGRNDAEGYFYYVMELADGVDVQSPKSKLQSRPLPAVPTLDSGLWTLDSYKAHTLRTDLAAGRLPAARVLEIGLVLTEALSHLHRQGLVHRDVKPSNVIFVNGRPKLADIGLVTDTSDQRSILGTEGYLLLECPGTPQGDIFALGKVLYEAATGLDRREFPKLPEALRSWPDGSQFFEINEVILKACAANARDRYARADLLLDDLRALQLGSSLKRSRIARTLRETGKKAGLALGALSVIGVAIVVLGRGLAFSPANPDGPDSRIEEANKSCDRGLTIVRGDGNQLAEAQSKFQTAIGLDSKFPRPYIGLLEMSLQQSGPEAAATRQRATAKLKQLEPRLGATLVAESIKTYCEGDFHAAEQLAQKGISASPDYELGHRWLAFILLNAGRTNEAQAELDQSRKLTVSPAAISRQHIGINPAALAPAK